MSSSKEIINFYKPFELAKDLIKIYSKKLQIIKNYFDSYILVSSLFIILLGCAY